MKQTIHLEELSWTELQDLPKEDTIIYIPISPLEEHGPHLPIGTDLLTITKASHDSITDLQKKRPHTIALLHPPLPLGTASVTTGFVGTNSTNSRTIARLLCDTITNFASHGFHYFLICTYHMDLGHLKGIYKAISAAKRRQPHISVAEPWAAYFHSNKALEKEPDPGFDTTKEVHADFRETSLMIYLYPHLVKPNYKKLDTKWTDLYSPKVLRKNLKDLGLSQGYVGTPKHANPDYGRWFYQETVDSLTTAATKLLDGEKIDQLPKKTKMTMKLLFWA